MNLLTTLYEPSQALYQFLQQNGLRATHYFIGLNILASPNLFMTAYEALGDDIAGKLLALKYTTLSNDSVVHTWTHPYLTSLNNTQVLGELGWTMQIIHDPTNGRIPRFFRPPYGDIDNRIRAIAQEVFGMTAIIWNQE